MNISSRYVTLVLTNVFLLVTMLVWLDRSGIDIAGTTLAENADNIGFMFDFLFFIVISFSLNLLILNLPSKRRNTINRMIALLEQHQKNVVPARRKRKPAV